MNRTSHKAFVNQIKQNIKHGLIYLIGAIFIGAAGFSGPLMAQEANQLHAQQPDIENLLTHADKAWLAAHRVVRIAGPRAFPPFYYYAKDGQPHGMAWDYLQIILEYLNINVEIMGDLPWPDVLAGAQARQIDLIACTAKTVERAAYLNFSNPTMSFPLVIITRTDAPFIGGLHDLIGKKVAFVRGIAAYEWLKQDKIAVIPYFVNSPLAGFTAVSMGNAAATIENLATASYLIQTHELPNLKVAAPTSYENYNLYIAVRKDWPQLISIINKAFGVLTAQQHANIRSQWLAAKYGDGIRKIDAIKWALVIASLAVAVFLIFFMWNRRLRKEIVERQTAETALRQSRAQYTFLIENMADIIWSLDMNFQTQYVSGSIEHLLGFTPAERMMQPIEQTVTPASLIEIERRLTAELGQENHPDADPGRSINIETEYYKKDGSTLWMENRVKAIRDKQGQAIGILGVSRDISKRKAAMQAIERQHGMLSSILANAADGICVCHAIDHEPFTRFTHWNNKMRQLTGYSMTEINRLGWYQTMYPDPAVQQRAIARMAGMRIGQDLQSEEWVITTKDGRQKPLGISTSVLKSGDNHLHVLAIMHDISEQKQYEKQLIESRKQWEDIFQAIGHPTLILDPRHRILAANRATLEITGLSAEQIRNRKCHEIFHRKNQPPGDCPMETLLHQGAQETIQMEMEALEGVFLVSCTPVFDKNGDVTKIIHIATDITEQKKLETQVRQTRKMEAIGTLAGGIAHEFNNILSIILGNAELAIDDLPESVPIRRMLAEIHKASLRGRDVVKQLLSFSRKTSAKMQSLDLAKIVNETVVFLRASIPANIQFEADVSQKCRSISGNETQLCQIMINLCNNAAQAMEDRGGKLDICVENIDVAERKIFLDQVLEPGAYVRLAVCDTGLGIADDAIEQVFHPFYTTKAVHQGTGMGLAVVYGIIKNHHAYIEIQSKPGQGTSVYCYFPVSVDAPDATVANTKGAAGGKETILFVDDEAALVSIGLQRLRRLGYRVEAATDPRQALQLFKADPMKFDLVITDMTMPHMTGDQLIQRLMDIRSDVKTIICSGYSKKIDTAKALDIGARGFIMKPLDSSRFAETVRSVLDADQS